MDFNGTLRAYANLKDQFDQGHISGDEFEKRVNDMTVTDAQGTLWQIGVKTGTWYRYDGQNWVEDTPSAAVAPARPSAPIPAPRPQYAPVPPASRPFNWLWVGGGVAALALVGCVGVVLVFFVLGRDQPDPNNQVVPQPIITPRAVVPPLLATPRPVIDTPISGQIAGPGWDPNSTFFDDFSNPASGWDRQSPSGGITEYANGKYHIQVNKSNLIVWSKFHKNFTDQVGIEVDATKAGGPDNNVLGVFCRYLDKDNFYEFMISSDGFALIGKQTPGKSVGLSSEKMMPTNKIQQGAATNHIRATCMGDTLTLSVNGQEVARATDSSITSGDVGLYAGTFDTSGVDILFDNFSASAY